MSVDLKKVYSLENRFGLAVSLYPDRGHYEVRYKESLWFGIGIVSILHESKWYRSQTALGFKDREDHSLASRKNAELVVVDIESGSENDIAGRYNFINVYWELKDTDKNFITGFRMYEDNPYLIFLQKYPNGFKHYANGNWTVPSVVFPQFSTHSGGRIDLYSWAGGAMFAHSFGYGRASCIGGTVDFLLLSDYKHESLILSPYSNYLVATQQSTHLGGKYREFSQVINCGIQGLAEELPVGYEHMHVMAVGSGINNTLRIWGNALLAKSGKKAPSKYQDDTLKHITYWDDYGAYYCQHGFKEDGYETYEDLIIAIEEDARKNDLYISAYQLLDLDQSRYRDGLFEPRADLFPHGLQWLSEKLGKRIHAYVAWLASGGPYRESFHTLRVKQMEQFHSFTWAMCFTLKITGNTPLIKCFCGTVYACSAIS